MKEFLFAVLVTVVLTLIFSYTQMPEMIMPSDGMGPKYPGNSGMVLPGKGAKPARMMARELIKNDRESGEQVRTAQREDTEEEQARPEKEMEVTKTMNEIMIAFWHGVAAVLIGEAAALLVAVAWMMIREDRNV